MSIINRTNTRRQGYCTIIFKEIHLTLSFVFLLWFCYVYYDFQLQMAFMSSLERITDVIYDKMERLNATISMAIYPCVSFTKDR
jgi:hypothetical protein